MKKILLALISPLMAFASHSIDLGAFYSCHKEPGYHYDLAGIAMNYEIGNSKGLKAIGSLHFSNNSDLLFIQSKNELVFYIPLGTFNLTPFTGGHALHHNVFKHLPVVGTLTRIHMPLGIGINTQIDEFFLEARSAYLHPLAHNLVQDEGVEFFGKKFRLQREFMVEATGGYQVGEKLLANLTFNWCQSTNLEGFTWTIEPYITMKF